MFKISTKLKIAFIVIISFFTSTQTILKAQISVGDAFMQGNRVQIGIELTGGFEGANAVPPVTGTLWRFRPAGGLAGFVADPLVSGWANYNGDFFTPGTPENGWGLLVGNTAGGTQFSNNRAGLTNIIVGATLAYLNTGSKINVCWNGSVVSGTNNLSVNLVYSLGTNDLYYTTSVRITNNGTATIPEMYYYRNVDPDNNHPLSGDFQTTNLIENQPTSDPCGLACVSASAAGGGGWGASYMAFAGVGTDFRVCRGGFGNRNGFQLWNGTPPFIQTVGSSLFADEAISLSYKMLNILPGTTRNFNFVTILRSADKVQAINSLMALSYPGSAISGPSACSPLASDTAKICGPTKIEVSGATTAAFTWTWNPPTGLSSSTTFSTIANPSVTTTYTIIGTPIAGPCTPTASAIFTIVVVPLVPTIVINPSITVCVGSPIVLSAGSTGGIYSWFGPAGFTSATPNPTIAPSTLANSGTYTVTNSSACSQAMTTVSVIPPPTLTLTASSNSICTGTSATLTANSSSSSIYWTPGATLSSTTASVVIASPATTTTYSVFVGSGTCTNSAVTSISVVPTPTLSVTSATICAGQTATLTATGATSYTWSSGSFVNSTSVSPSATTVYTVIGANSGVCATVKTTTVVVFAYPVVVSSSVTNVKCNGIATGSIAINATGATSYSWLPATGSTTNTASGLSAGSYTCVLSTGPSCSTIATFSVSEPTLLVATINGTNTVCGQCNGVATTTASGGVMPYTYVWSPSSSTQTIISGLCPNTYTATITDANGCINIRTITILPSPVFQASVTASNTEIYQGENVNLTGLGGGTYTWSPTTSLTCTNCANTVANPYYDITYCVDVTSSDGCRDSACVEIIVKCGNVFVPNAFSPNNDGHNDELQVYGNCITDLTFRLYDRWGEMVFESFDTTTKWDGKYKGYAVNAGVFVYQLSAKLKSGEVVNKTGNVTVIK